MAKRSLLLAPAHGRPIIFSIFAVLLLVCIDANAQMMPQSLGVVASAGQGTDLGLSYALSEKTRINLGVGFATEIPDSGMAQTNFSIQTGVWFVQPVFEGVSTFFGGAAEFQAVSGTRAQGDLGVILQAGAEYAFARRFSIGSWGGLALRTGDTSAGGQQGTGISTIRAGAFFTWWFL